MMLSALVVSTHAILGSHAARAGNITYLLIALFVFIFFLKCSAFDLSEMEMSLGEAVRRSIMLAGIKEAHAAACMGINESTLRKGLRGDPAFHLNLSRMVGLSPECPGLPYKFWACFVPVLMFIIAQKHLVQSAEDLGLRKHA